MMLGCKYITLSSYRCPLLLQQFLMVGASLLSFQESELALLFLLMEGDKPSERHNCRGGPLICTIHFIELELELGSVLGG